MAPRGVGQAPDHRVTRSALASAPPAPVVSLDHPAGHHGPLGGDVLADHLQAQLIETAERGQVRGGEGNVRHEGLVVQERDLNTPILPQGPPPRTPSSQRSDNRSTHSQATTTPWILKSPSW